MGARNVAVSVIQRHVNMDDMAVLFAFACPFGTTSYPNSSFKVKFMDAFAARNFRRSVPSVLYTAADYTAAFEP